MIKLIELGKLTRDTKLVPFLSLQPDDNVPAVGVCLDEGKEGLSVFDKSPIEAEQCFVVDFS